MGAFLILDGQRPHRREHVVPALRESIGRVVEQRMPARLRLEQQRKGRIPGDVDGFDGVHLAGDGERHDRSCCACFHTSKRMLWRARQHLRQCNWRLIKANPDREGIC